MRVAYLVTLLASLAVASPFEELIKRADLGQQVLSDLKSEDAAGKKVNASFTAIGGNSDKPSGKDESAILKANNALNKAIQKTTKDATSSDNFSSANSEAISNYVLNTLVGDVKSILTNVENHEPGINKAGLDDLVVQNLQKQLKLVKAQGAAITKKLAQPYKGQAPAVLKMITDKYEEAIGVYGG